MPETDAYRPAPVDQSRIRNFCIIAHIDHGKSTLADRLLEATGTLTSREMQAQVLDSMDLERERGITIKSHAIRMPYKAADGQQYVLDLIDTPGHVDFTYEVSRALNACEGAILVVDAAQGIEAQTISNLYMAIGQDLEIIPVLNKVDLPSAQPELVAQSITDLIGGDPDDVLHVSAKTGMGIEAVLERIVERVPAPAGDPEAPLQALIFDSTFDTYRGSIVYIRVKEGTLRKGDAIQFMATGAKYFAEEIGHLKLTMQPVDELGPGEVGYLIGSVKDVADTRVGDTVTHQRNGATEQLPGYRDVKPMVFSGIYPTDSNDFEDLRGALEKLQLNDAALTYEAETSAALGFGFRVGFLGMLHMEVVQERLDREFGLDIVTTMPNVRYSVELSDRTTIEVENPSDMPDPGRIHEIREPYVKAEIITPTEYIGALMGLCQDRRGTYLTQEYLTTDRVNLKYELPLAEIVFDFYDKLKSVSRGYASFDYDFIDERTSKLVKLDVMLNGDTVDALSTIVHRDKAYDMGRRLSQKLRELIPRQMFDVAIQAGIGNKIIARETVKALRKDVTAKCYGGDISRKRKLLEKQKEGKKRMKQVGAVEVPQEAFLAVLSME
ncbi:translation elongation factor 4 [Rubrivirga sp. SAORIC476]|uniref:translation elongation factor 4 n=1 Tax=Rubrivirga sp. SAORIC476 TaxID=1961794 RepID=UPI0021008364|nr:translation elongation factor 4 [Rubrivirga sp. SAORIC476]